MEICDLIPNSMKKKTLDFCVPLPEFGNLVENVLVLLMHAYSFFSSHEC
jgi:hypothetical protein